MKKDKNVDAEKEIRKRKSKQYGECHRIVCGFLQNKKDSLKEDFVNELGHYFSSSLIDKSEKELFKLST